MVTRIYKLNSLLQHELSLLSLLYLHRLSSGNIPNAVDPSPSVFRDSSSRWLASISQQGSLRNDLQQWGLLHQRQLSATISDGSVSNCYIRLTTLD
jgi:hypothetical protein